MLAILEAEIIIVLTQLKTTYSLRQISLTFLKVVDLFDVLELGGSNFLRRVEGERQFSEVAEGGMRLQPNLKGYYLCRAF